MSETEFLETAIDAARTAGSVLLEWQDRFTVSEKNRSDLVTEADLESQEVIASLIGQQYPEHGLLGEEGLEKSDGGSGYRWIIDPLDGTGNYVHGIPYFAVSIALECDGDLAVGVVLDPTRDEFFTAVRGQGAHLNGQRLSVSADRISSLEQALVMASLPVGVESSDDPAIARFLRVLTVAQHTQRTGSAAMNLAYLAAGRLDAFFSTSLKPWDMAAGALLVREAGGRVTDLSQAPFDISVPSLLASNGSDVHRQLAALL